MLRATLLAALLTTAIPVTALAQTADELKNDERSPGDVLVYGTATVHSPKSTSRMSAS
jgi:alcohol dehydrogenase (cytochrome c)